MSPCLPGPPPRGNSTACWSKFPSCLVDTDAKDDQFATGSLPACELGAAIRMRRPAPEERARSTSFDSQYRVAFAVALVRVGIRFPLIAVDDKLIEMSPCRQLDLQSPHTVRVRPVHCKLRIEHEAIAIAAPLVEVAGEINDVRVRRVELQQLAALRPRRFPSGIACAAVDDRS